MRLHLTGNNAMGRIRKLDGVMVKSEKRRKLDKAAIKPLHVQIHVDTYSWLCSIAAGRGIGWALDDLAQQHAANHNSAKQH